MYIQTKECFSKPEFVASYVNFTATISDEGVAVENGKELVKQGRN